MIIYAVIYAVISAILLVPFFKKNMDEIEPDIHLPVFLKGFGLFLIFASVIGGVYAILVSGWIGFGVAIAIELLGFAALLCHKNQKVEIISETQFKYTTYLGKNKIYSFSDIKSLKQNSDSMTLYVGYGKVHIESMAKISDRFYDKMNNALSIIEL